MRAIFDYLSNNVGSIITIIFSVGVIGILFSKALKVLKEIGELLNAIVVAFADKKLTKEEVAVIVKEANDIPFAVKNMLRKE